MQIKEALKWGHEQLFLTSSSARLDAEILLSNILRKPVTFFLAHNEHNICSIKLWLYKRAIRKRKQGMPVAYLTGRKEFYFLDFFVNRHVLVPRPDTEILVECVIGYIKSEARNPKPETNIKIANLNPKNVSDFEFRISNFTLLDIGTGSACIPISVCKNVGELTEVATDISGKALKVARKNIKKHGLTSRIQLIHSDLLNNVNAELFEGTEVIVTANLPYIPTDYQISPELKYEPQISLFGGTDGLSLYKKILPSTPLRYAQGDNFLDNKFRFWSEVRPKAIFFELFEDQIAILKTKLPDYKLKYIKNMSGKARVMVMERDAE